MSPYSLLGYWFIKCKRTHYQVTWLYSQSWSYLQFISFKINMSDTPIRAEFSPLNSVSLKRRKSKTHSLVNTEVWKLHGKMSRKIRSLGDLSPGFLPWNSAVWRRLDIHHLLWSLSKDLSFLLQSLWALKLFIISWHIWGLLAKTTL